MKGTIFKRTRRGAGGSQRNEACDCADSDLPQGANGKRRRCRLTGFKTRKEAEIAVARKITEIQHGVDITPQKLTVRGLLDRYLSNRATECSERTIERYREIADRYINATLGDAAVKKLSPLAIQELYEALGSRLSARTVHHVHTLFKAAFTWAVRKELISRSPFIAVDAPTVRSKEARYLSFEQAATLLRAAEGSQWHPAFIVALATGARRGELCALKWAEVDLENRTMTIRASLSDVGGKLRLKGTKSDRVRTVPLSAMATAALRARRVDVAQAKLRAGGSYKDEDYVFAGVFGQPMVPDNFSTAFRYYAQKNNLEGVSLHSLRHTTASWMIGAGTDIRTVQAILGHSVASTTLNIYAHAMGKLQSQAVETIDANLIAADKGA